MGIEVRLTWERQRPRGRMGLCKLPHHHEVTMPTMTQALAKLKANLPDLLPARSLLRIATAIGIRFRQRTLTPAVTSALFLQQVLHGNPAVGELRRRTKLDCTDSAYCQARQRLTVGYFHRLAFTASCERSVRILSRVSECAAGTTRSRRVREPGPRRPLVLRSFCPSPASS